MAEDISAAKKAEWIAKLKEFVQTRYAAELVSAANAHKSLAVDCTLLEMRHPELTALLRADPKALHEIAEEAMKAVDLVDVDGNAVAVRLRFFNLPELTSIRDLRARHIAQFISTEGTVRRASEIRPEIKSRIWQCPECEAKIEIESIGTFAPKPFECPGNGVEPCGNRKGFKEVEKTMVDTRMITIEEPFELTEGDRPSQVAVALREDLVDTDGRRITEAGSRLRITGVLKEVPKDKFSSTKLDFFIEADHAQPTEVGWERVDITPENEAVIRALAAQPDIYEQLIASMAPSLYGLTDIKESIILQLFGGVPRTLKDKTRFRGDIHILLLGDPASGKSQLLKLVPNIIPRGKYVSGKGASVAGLTATVTKDEQFMGGWVLEAGALVLANRGLLSIDEFEKMAPEDQVGMHEAMEQQTVSVAKASIVATLPAQTSILAGGNPKYSRFDALRSIADQITIPDTLLSRFDLKFILRDDPRTDRDTRIVEHVLQSREEGDTLSVPKIDPTVVRKYIAFAKSACTPRLTRETGKLLKDFYIQMRKKAESGGPVPITLRQFEALIRLSEASARIQLSDVVRKEDADRAIRLMYASLRELGYDPHTKTIDIDKAEGGVGFTERNRLQKMMDLINALSQKKKDIPERELLELAEQEGIAAAEELVEKLKREGTIFSPNVGFLRKV